MELRAPATKLTLVIEGAHGSEIVQKIIGKMRHASLEAIAADPEIQAIYRPLHERHVRSIDIIRKQSVCQDGVVLFRPGRPGYGGIQQIHPVLFVSAIHLHGFGEHVEFPDQGFGGIESVGARSR